MLCIAKTGLNFLIGLCHKVKNHIELSRYDNFTIAQYFRAQGAQIGDDCYIIPRSLGTEPYLVKIGNHVSIATDVKFITHDGGPWVFRRDHPDLQVFGPIIIEDNCVIGRDAILFCNTRIGPNSIVGAGSVVISDVPPNTVVMGVPARPFGSLEKYKQKCLERWRIQKPSNSLFPAGSSTSLPSNIAPQRKKLRHHLLQIYSHELKS